MEKVRGSVPPDPPIKVIKMKYNYGPEGIVKEITANEFWNHFSNYSPDNLDHCQIIGERLKDYTGREISKYTKKVKTCMLAANCFVYGDFTFVVEHNHWEKSQRFWKVTSCHHEYKEIGSQRARELGITHFGGCFHVFECLKCHHAYGQDSSG